MSIAAPIAIGAAFGPAGSIGYQGFKHRRFIGHHLGAHHRSYKRHVAGHHRRWADRHIRFRTISVYLQRWEVGGAEASCLN